MKPCFAECEKNGETGGNAKVYSGLSGAPLLFLWLKEGAISFGCFEPAPYLAGFLSDALKRNVARITPKEDGNTIVCRGLSGEITRKSYTTSRPENPLLALTCPLAG